MTDNAMTEIAVTDNDRWPPEPLGGAGLFDVDPDQGHVSQSPQQSVQGDVDALPEDLEL